MSAPLHGSSAIAPTTTASSRGGGGDNKGAMSFITVASLSIGAVALFGVLYLYLQNRKREAEIAHLASQSKQQIGEEDIAMIISQLLEQQAAAARMHRQQQQFSRMPPRAPQESPKATTTTTAVKAETAVVSPSSTSNGVCDGDVCVLAVSIVDDTAEPSQSKVEEIIEEGLEAVSEAEDVVETATGNVDESTG